MLNPKAREETAGSLPPSPSPSWPGPHTQLRLRDTHNKQTQRVSKANRLLELPEPIAGQTNAAIMWKVMGRVPSHEH